VAGLGYLLLAIFLVRSLPLAARPPLAPTSVEAGLVDDPAAAAAALVAPAGGAVTGPPAATARR
jgi:hypothetical protein